MRQRLFALHSGPHVHCKAVCLSGIGRPVTSDAHRPGFGSPSWHFWAVGKSVGNCTRHRAQMARVSREDFWSQSDFFTRYLVSEDAAGPKLSRRDPPPVATVSLAAMPYGGCRSALAGRTTT